MGNSHYTSVTFSNSSIRTPRSSYTLSLFVLDVLLLVITAGHWVVYMWCREWRRNTNRRYDLLKWVADLIMAWLTAGIWLIWVVFREISRR